MDCQTSIQLIDEYFDRRLSQKKRKKVERHLAECPDCRESYLEYERLFADLKNLEPVACPDEVIQSVNEITGIQRRKTAVTSLFSRFSFEFPVRLRALRLAGAVIVLILIGFILFSQFHKSTPNLNDQYTQAEIEQAANQVKLALGYVNASTMHASEILEKQVFPEDVIKPMKSSLKQALKPFLDGGKS